MFRFILPFGVVCAIVPSVSAHFSMLLPQSASGKKGEAVTLVYQWGHPFEHQLFDAPPPARLVVLEPDGKKRELTKSLEKIKHKGVEEKEVITYRLRFTPQLRGDYTFILNTPPMWMSEDKEFLQDTVKVVLHVQAQKGWDANPDHGFNIVPITRPYGLLPGMVFQARVQERPAIVPEGPVRPQRADPQANLPVLIEKFNPIPPKNLPPDELLTFATKTDPNGILTCTLPTGGWWSITAQRDGGRRNYDGKEYPVRQRATLWVYVEMN